MTGRRTIIVFAVWLLESARADGIINSSKYKSHLAPTHVLQQKSCFNPHHSAVERVVCYQARPHITL